jgi:glycosyltransferase involved in cell wall biosynthesis
MHKKKICCSLNFAPHYREEVFLLMEKELDCDFYFGNKTFSAIKKMDYERFSSNINELRFKKVFRKFYYLKGQVGLSFFNYKYYIITGQPNNISSWLLLFFNKIRGKETFIWNHGWYGDEKFIKRIIKKIQFKLITGYLLYGKYARDLMLKEGFDGNKLHVIYNSLHYQRQLDLRKELKHTSIYKNHFNNNYPTIIFIGRLTKEKKLDLLIEAIHNLNRDDFYLNLVFVGEGIDRTNLEKFVTKNNLNKFVWFYGKSYDEKVIGELIFNASLCVSPGNIGLTAIHSFTFGTPVITHSNFINQGPEFEVIEEGVTGLFFLENDIQSLELSIKNWLLNNPEKSNILVEKCFAVIDKYYNPSFQVSLLKEILK